jgi:patatin-related protein
MREKELRLALVCYGGISLAVYMHGITKEIWRLVRASRAFHTGEAPTLGSETVYHQLLKDVVDAQGLKLRVFADIVAGASAGGINGIFLSQAIATGQSLEPLTDMWLEQADVERLLDPDARPLWRFSKFWAIPLAWLATRRPGGTVDQTVDAEARDEVRTKLSHFVRARWFEPPFGGVEFTTMLLNAFDAMARAPAGPALLPSDQPLDLFVTVTDFRGHMERLKLNSPREIAETEHRLIVSFRNHNALNTQLGDAAELTFAARATASFPGAFPPFSIAELDRVLKKRRQAWPDRAGFISRLLPRAPEMAEQLVLIDGSVLANAPFRPAIEALRDRPARREVDRRFVYIDPKPGMRSVNLGRKGAASLPGFFATILGAMSDIPREQPIRDNLEAIEGRSSRIRRMQRIVDAVRPEVEASIHSLFGRTFFLDRPTAARLQAWRSKAQDRAALEAGHAYASYGHVKLSGVVEEIAALVGRILPDPDGMAQESFRLALWAEVRTRGADQIVGPKGRGASDPAITFFRDHDLGFRIRRLRFVARTLTNLVDSGESREADVMPVRTAIYERLAPYLDREGARFFSQIDRSDVAVALDRIAAQRDLIALDTETDAVIAEALAACPKAERRTALMAYLGFPYYDISTLPMLQGEGLDEFDPVKVDRIAPDDARSIRAGGAAATLKGIQLNSFGAFFSRAYRENDYLWGRLHGAERLIDIIFSTLPGTTSESEKIIAAVKRQAFEAILTEETPRLKQIPDLFETLWKEIASGPLAKPEGSS